MSVNVTTPVIGLELDVGVYRIELNYQGLVAEKQVTITSGQNLHDLTFLDVSGTLIIRAFYGIDEVEVAANGRIMDTGEIFVTPATYTKPAGPYTVSVSYLGQTKESLVEVVNGMDATLNVYFNAPVQPSDMWVPVLAAVSATAVGFGIYYLY